MDQNELERLEFEKKKKELLRKILTKEALERLGRVRIAHPDIAERAEAVIIEWYLQGKVKEIDDSQLKSLLSKLVE